MTPEYAIWEFWLQAVAVLIGVGNSVCLVVLWFASRGRVTREAIDRVEALARSMHAAQETRLVRMESELLHTLTRKDLDGFLQEMYGLIHDTKESVAALTKEIAGVESAVSKMSSRQDRLNEMIMQRGIEK